MSGHGLQAAIKAQRPGRCTRVFIPKKRDGKLNYRRTCLCGLGRNHEGRHVCPECGGQWSL